MSEEQLKAFVDKVKSDIELQEKLKAATTSEDAIEIAKETGFAITTEDIQSMQSARVSDEELEDAAGGRQAQCRMDRGTVWSYNRSIDWACSYTRSWSC